MTAQPLNFTSLMSPYNVRNIISSGGVGNDFSRVVEVDPGRRQFIPVIK